MIICIIDPKTNHANDKSYSVKENHIILNLSSVHKGILKFRYGQTFRCTFKIHFKARIDVSPLRRRILSSSSDNRLRAASSNSSNVLDLFLNFLLNKNYGIVVGQSLLSSWTSGGIITNLKYRGEWHRTFLKIK